MSLLRLFSRAKPAPPQVRSYDAATGMPRRFAGASNRFGSYAPEASAARGSIQSRARAAAANNPLAASAISAWATATVGAGILATAQHPDPEIRAALDAAFARWTKRADVTGRTDWSGLQAAAVRAELIDGEGFLLWAGDQLRQIPAEQVAMDLSSNLSGGRAIVNGVEIDASGAPVAYHIHPQNPADTFAGYSAPVRIEAAEVIHLARLPGPGALRGVSALAPVLLRLAEMDGLEDAILTNAKVSALLSVLLTNENAIADGDDPLADGQTLEPGAILRLPGGWKVSTTAPQQAQQLQEHLQHLVRVIASGVGVPAHLVDGNLAQANYSSLRAALVSFRQRIEQYQFHTLAPQLLDPAWRRVVTAAVLTGEVNAPLDDALFAVEWIPPAQPWVDPLKDAEATIAMMGAGLMSRRQAVAALGYSIEALDAEIAADRKREVSFNLTFGTEGKTDGDHRES